MTDSAVPSAVSSAAPPISLIDPLQDPRWNELIDGSSVGLFLSTPWLGALAQTYGFHFQAAAVETDGDLEAALPFTVIDDLRGTRIRALPFCDLIELPGANPNQASALYTHLAKQGLPTEVITQACAAPQDNENQGEDCWQSNASHLWHTISLEQDRQALLAACGSNTRNRIRKVEREGFTVWADPNPNAVDDFFNLHLGVRKYRHQLLPQPRALFHAIAERFFATGNGWVIKVERDDSLASAAVVLRHQDTLYYKFSASDPAFRNIGTNHAVAFGAVSHALDIGCSSVDLGRTPLAQPGLVSFKDRLGAQNRPVVRSRRAGTVSAAQQEAGQMLGRLTALLVDPNVPDTVTEAAGTELYRYFA